MRCTCSDREVLITVSVYGEILQNYIPINDLFVSYQYHATYILSSMKDE